MKLTEFAVLVAQLEKGNREVNIAQIKEILKVINILLDGKLYSLIRKDDDQIRWLAELRTK